MLRGIFLNCLAFHISSFLNLLFVHSAMVSIWLSFLGPLLGPCCFADSSFPYSPNNFSLWYFYCYYYRDQNSWYPLITVNLSYHLWKWAGVIPTLYILTWRLCELIIHKKRLISLLGIGSGFQRMYFLFIFYFCFYLWGCFSAFSLFWVLLFFFYNRRNSKGLNCCWVGLI